MANTKNILIGGITGGIGSALARRLHTAGHTIAGFARDEAKLSELSNELGDFDYSVCDATDSGAVESSVSALHDKLGTIDAYVHAIGSIYLKPAHLTADEDWANTLNLNLNSAFYALRSVMKRMQKQPEGGSFLFYSTAAAQTGIANHEAIAAAKGGIEAMVRSAASTYSGRGVRVNAIAPSLTDTPLSKPIVGSEQALEISKKMHPLGTIGEADDVASLSEWMISDAAKFVTGQVYVMDGGLSKIVPKPKM
jgi:NAD(P)-dependent dehydrogenase (short-subunit alcohol dehydrogenase family)